ncbi:MAG: beta-propeller domain-containing protein [bacterium]
MMKKLLSTTGIIFMACLIFSFHGRAQDFKIDWPGLRNYSFSGSLFYPLTNQYLQNYPDGFNSLMYRGSFSIFSGGTNPFSPYGFTPTWQSNSMFTQPFSLPSASFSPFSMGSYGSQLYTPFHISSFPWQTNPVNWPTKPTQPIQGFTTRTASIYQPLVSSIWTPSPWILPWSPVTPVPSTPKVKTPDLLYSIETDRDIYGESELITITFKVSNTGEGGAEIHFSSGKQFDVYVKNDEGELVWQLSHHMSYTQAETSITLNPGEAKSFEAEWDQKDDDEFEVPQGTYRLEACLTATQSQYNKKATTDISLRALPTFSSCEELRDTLKELYKPKPVISPPFIPFPWPIFYGGFGGFGGFGGLSYGISSFSSASYSGAAYSYSSTPSSGTGTSGSSSDYSTTNTQVTGVDESDVIKNDGAYLYLIKNKSVRIVRAYPPTEDDFMEVNNLTFDSDFTPTQLYVYGDILVVIGSELKPAERIYYADNNAQAAERAYYMPRKNFTRIYIYNIADRANVLETRTVKVEARYLQSRRVEDTLYIILNENPPYDILYKDTLDPRELLPIYHDSSFHNGDEGAAICDCDEIAYLPGYTEPNYLVVMAIPLNDTSKAVGSELILGKSEQVYASVENLYITSTSYNREPWPRLPVWFSWDWWWPFRSVTTNTVIYKFKLDEPSPAYTYRAKIPGRIMNQFSMDEHNGNFRIASTTSSPKSNNVYVFDETMKLLGICEDIGAGEDIKSVRFVGDKGYVVTIRVIDPFFVISLYNPEHPQLLGELKVPGYTEYLHPYDDTHIIGFGREVVNNIQQGMKVALYDITDPGNPTELQTEAIGYRGTTSELLTNHKALLFSQARNMMAFPVTVTERASGYSYQYIFQGAYIYYIDQNGFSLETEITHYDQGTFPSFSLATGENSIKRIIYIGDYYYTISDSKIKAVDGLNNYSEEAVTELD